MASNSKTSVTKAQNGQHKKILSQLLKLDGNRRCCDCFARGPTWASVNLGLFVCLNCSGIHRSLGTHLSKVRSTTLDTWLPEQVEFVSKLGNVRANQYWEATLPAGHRRPTEGDMSGLKVFITDKYQNQVYPALCFVLNHQQGSHALCCLQKFVSRDYDSPPNIDNYLDHPFMRQTDASQAASPPAASGQMPEKAAKAEASSSSLASLGQRATSPVPAAAPDKSAAAVRRPMPPPTATAQMVPAAPQMMDLLSLEDSTASPIAQPSQPAADNNDGTMPSRTCSAAAIDTQLDCPTTAQYPCTDPACASGASERGCTCWTLLERAAWPVDTDHVSSRPSLLSMNNNTWHAKLPILPAAECCNQVSTIHKSHPRFTCSSVKLCPHLQETGQRS